MRLMNYQFWRLFLALDERHLVAGAWPAKSRRIPARQAGELASLRVCVCDRIQYVFFRAPIKPTGDSRVKIAWMAL
jgi:hypothetical protein